MVWNYLNQIETKMCSSYTHSKVLHLSVGLKIKIEKVGLCGGYHMYIYIYIKNIILKNI